MPKPNPIPELLATTDIRYIRRMVREINKQSGGVYLDGSIAGTTYNPRLCGKVTFAQGKIRFPTASTQYEISPNQVEGAFIEGAAGRTICARRLER